MRRNQERFLEIMKELAENLLSNRLNYGLAGKRIVVVIDCPHDHGERSSLKC